MEDIRPYRSDPEETLRLPREDKQVVERRDAAADDELPFEIPRD